MQCVWITAMPLGCPHVPSLTGTITNHVTTL
jgi:hypothetical protein